MPKIAKRVVEANLSDYYSICAKPNLLKVTTIKKKFLDQMPAANHSDLLENEFKVIGKTNVSVVIQRKNGQFVCDQYHFFRGFVMEVIRQQMPADATQDEIWELAHEEIEKIPQIFIS